ncbi:rhodanese-like domain-containing protein [Ottowia sp.]|jgi:rhodanese-related sulfurtransferase|uniref:rhodanese-like domain-containing protein n=1 Tax=Ottowia sp. TaxID=1898956 RepID=UPI002C34DCA4|nr:rhodanese-like domain-containing protein [Ottowia sp.]HRN75072.1 rhodanese-like domain-containing protein [Ottowia sp.]HRQ02176.1 rhodanese-like domain-containing protein [Ottowia sp.]
MIEQVTPQALPAWLQAARANGEPLLLDVREPAEWRVASVHANGVEVLQMPMMSIPPRLHELDAARPVAVLCHHGGRSMQVAMFLAQRGFTHVANIAGGIDAWSLTVDPSIPRY